MDLHVYYRYLRRLVLHSSRYDTICKTLLFIYLLVACCMLYAIDKGTRPIQEQSINVSQYRSNVSQHRSNGLQHRSNVSPHRSNGVHHRSNGVKHRSNGVQHRSKGLQHRSNGSQDLSNRLQHRPNIYPHRSNVSQHRPNGVQHRPNGLQHRSNRVQHRSKESQPLINDSIHHAKELLKDKCKFGNTFDENLRKIENLRFPASIPWVKKLGFDSLPRRQPTSLPVLVTAASNIGYFFRSQTLIKTIETVVRPKYPHIKLVFYDLGLTNKQAKEIRRICKCEVRKFPFEKYPEHVRDGRTYAFKPIIINTLYKEFGNVWWLDASQRFITGDLDIPFRYLDDRGILFFTLGQSLNIANYTHPAMFKYFNEEPCRYLTLGDVESGNVAFRDSHVARIVLKQWAACALDKDCIAPQGSDRFCPEPGEPIDETLNGTCHRFDQSALGILVRRLYHEQNDYPMIQPKLKLVTLERAHTVKAKAYYKFLEDS